MWWILFFSLLAPRALAQDCDAKALTSRVQDASPVAVAEAFVALEACDAEAAQKIAAAEILRVIPAREAADAMVASIRVGEGAVVRAWLAAQEADARSRTIARIGKACSGTPEIGDFFADAASEIGSDFWGERWHRGLADCRFERVQRLLLEAIDGSDVGRESRNRGGFFALLEVYARNLRVASVVKLTELLASARDEEEAVFLVSIFADAANVGGGEGIDVVARDAAVAAIQQAASDLPFKALDRARGTLISLGAETEASALAKHAWADVLLDGAYTYGVSAIEDITCRNGSKRAVLYIGGGTEAGMRWPDELAETRESTVKAAWSVDEAGRCKGTSTLEVKMSATPLGADALAAWMNMEKETFEEKYSDAKRSTLEQDLLSM
jgi:hypothetical protein